jgi:RNA polymerase sigma-70 factor (ECF subfamily)
MAVRVSELGNGAAKAGNGHARAALGSYGDLDDRMLVLDFQAGNDEAFAEIHRRYSGLARHVCQRILRNPEDADEATQEAMLRVYQGLPRFNGHYRLQPWVARIATNVSLDVTRARARRPRTGDQVVSDLHEDLHDRSGDPQEAVERALDREYINQVLAELPDHHREALVLREFEGRSHKEIGEALGVTPSQAKALIHRAKGSFRRTWNGGKGLQAFLYVFAALAKVPQLVKRLIQPAQELAATSAAAPAATSSVVTTGERVTAAAVAVLVAGSAAVGAVALKHNSHDPKPVSSPSAAIVAPAPPPAERPLDRAVMGPAQATKQKAKVKAEVVVSPVAPLASPTPSPSGTPSPTEPPPPPPAPAWSMAFESSVALGTWQPELVSSTAIGRAGHNLSFSQTVAGPTVKTGGEPSSHLYVEYFGSAEGRSGNVTLWIILDTEQGRFRYQASGSLTDLVETDEGLVEYTFTGAYYPVEWPAAEDGSGILAEGAPHDGTFRLELRFWSDGTSLYEAGLALQEPQPAPSAS